MRTPLKTYTLSLVLYYCYYTLDIIYIGTHCGREGVKNRLVDCQRHGKACASVQAERALYQCSRVGGGGAAFRRAPADGSHDSATAATETERVHQTRMFFYFQMFFPSTRFSVVSPGPFMCCRYQLYTYYIDCPLRHPLPLPLRPGRP